MAIGPRRSVKRMSASPAIEPPIELTDMIIAAWVRVKPTSSKMIGPQFDLK